MDIGAEDSKINPVGLFVRYARSFYQLLGNRRKFERLPISGTIKATCNCDALDTTHVCCSVDFSPRGIAMDCPGPMLPDRIVQLQSDDRGGIRLARVRYCQQRSVFFRVGLEFIVGLSSPVHEEPIVQA